MDESEMLPTNSSVIVDRVPLEMANYSKAKMKVTYRDIVFMNQEGNHAYKTPFAYPNNGKSNFG